MVQVPVIAHPVDAALITLASGFETLGSDNSAMPSNLVDCMFSLHKPDVIVRHNADNL
jgi:hypothetical protein